MAPVIQGAKKFVLERIAAPDGRGTRARRYAGGDRFGPMTAWVDDDARRTLLEGDDVGEAALEWSSRSTRREDDARLRERGVTGRVGAADVRIRHSSGLTRESRALHVEGLASGPVSVRLRGYKRVALERDGRVVAWFDSQRGEVTSDATPEEFALL